MFNILIYPTLFTVIASYIQLNDNTLLSLHPPTFILLYTESAFMVPFLSILRKVYQVFPVKLTVMTKEIRFNSKQVDISFVFDYTKYKIQRAMFKSVTLNLWRKLIKKTIESYKRFCSIYKQLSSLQSLERVSLLEPILLNNMNNPPHHKFQIEDERIQKLRDITLSWFINAVV